MIEKIKFVSIAVFVVLFGGLFFILVPQIAIWLFELGDFERFNTISKWYVITLFFSGAIGLLLPDKN